MSEKEVQFVNCEIVSIDLERLGGRKLSDEEVEEIGRKARASGVKCRSEDRSDNKERDICGCNDPNICHEC